MLSKRTQTNEAARCAVLPPALALLREPLALVEVGRPLDLLSCPTFTRTTTRATASQV